MYQKYIKFTFKFIKVLGEQFVRLGGELNFLRSPHSGDYTFCVEYEELILYN